MFPVIYGTEKCGEATVNKVGLYYHIVCKCDIPTKKPCKIVMQAGTKVFSLGTCIKEKDRYIIDTRIPCKHIESMDLQFKVQGNSRDVNEGFLIIKEDAPFPHLHNLSNARMQRRLGQVGIIFID